jgi:hypothetical protein
MEKRPYIDLAGSVVVTHGSWFSLFGFQSPQGICKRARYGPRAVVKDFAPFKDGGMGFGAIFFRLIWTAGLS